MVVPSSETAGSAPEPGSAGRRAQQKAETRARLIRAARQVFTEGSVVTTPLDAVAAEAGVSKATLFFHFADRVDLLMAISEQLYEEIYQDLRPIEGTSLSDLVDSFLLIQRDPRVVLMWKIGDMFSAAGHRVADVAYTYLANRLETRLQAEGMEPDRARHLTGVLTPALFLVGRRVAFDQTVGDEVARFVADVAYLTR